VPPPFVPYPFRVLPKVSSGMLSAEAAGEPVVAGMEDIILYNTISYNILLIIIYYIRISTGPAGTGCVTDKFRL